MTNVLFLSSAVFQLLLFAGSGPRNLLRTTYRSSRRSRRAPCRSCRTSGCWRLCFALRLSFDRLDAHHAARALDRLKHRAERRLRGGVGGAFRESSHAFCACPGCDHHGPLRRPARSLLCHSLAPVAESSLRPAFRLLPWRGASRAGVWSCAASPPPTRDIHASRPRPRPAGARAFRSKLAVALDFSTQTPFKMRPSEILAQTGARTPSLRANTMPQCQRARRDGVPNENRLVAVSGSRFASPTQPRRSSPDR